MTNKTLAIGILIFCLVAGITGVSAATLAIPEWLQIYSNGFGDPTTGEISALEAFNGYLYAGNHNPSDPGQPIDGAQIFRSQNGFTWTAVTQPGFGNSHDTRPPAILDFTVFNGRIYASTGRGGNPGQVWRSTNGILDWAPMTIYGFNDEDNMDITALAEYDGKIYAGVRNVVTGARIYSSFTGDNNSWSQVAPATPGTVPATVTSLVEFDGGLYAAIESEDPAQVWRSYGGSDWTTVISDGFSDSNTTMTGGMAVFGGFLFIGAGNTGTGAKLYYTSDGDTWLPAITPGSADTNNLKVESLFVFQDYLYASLQNSVTGIELWRTLDGTNWEQANSDGFGDIDNTGTNWGNASAVFQGHLYMGTSNVADGGELWRMQQQYIYIPLVAHDP